METLPVEKPIVLDILDSKSPALSSTNDMPVIETKPDASPPAKTEDAKAAPEAEDAEGKTQEESATSPAEPAASDEPKKPAKGVQKRLDELTRQREEAERRAKVAEENLSRALKAMEEGRVQKPASDAADEQHEEVVLDDEPQRPTRSDFSDPDAWDAAVLKYADDKAAWTARREVKAAEEKRLEVQREQAQRDATKSMFEAHNARVEVVKAKYADFTEVAESPDVQVSIPVAHAIVNHEQGPDIQYYLGQHKEEAARILALPVPAQLLEIGAIAATLKAKPADKPAAPAKPITSAPAPIKPVDKGTASVDKPLEEMSMEEYAARRKPELQAQMRPGARR